APLVVDTLMGLVDDLHRQGMAVLLVEQDVQVALEHSDRGYVLEAGRVAQEGAAAGLLEDARIREGEPGMGRGTGRDPSARPAPRPAPRIGYHSPMPRARPPVHVPPGAGRAYPMGPVHAIFKADGDETRQKYSISEWWLEPYTRGPGAHQHEEDDVFF